MGRPAVPLRVNHPASGEKGRSAEEDPTPLRTKRRRLRSATIRTTQHGRPQRWTPFRMDDEIAPACMPATPERDHRWQRRRGEGATDAIAQPPVNLFCLAPCETMVMLPQNTVACEYTI
ncbi:hypothetical protein MTO96_032055 [Rhipicephalus appendiculatus]